MSKGQKEKPKNKVWQATIYPGIFYKEVQKWNKNKRQWNPKTQQYEYGAYEKDYYFVGWYAAKKKRYQITFGSKNKFGWTAKSCADKMAEFRNNARNESGPKTFEEERDLNREAQRKEDEKLEEKKRLNTSFAEFFEDKYLPHAKLNKKPESIYREKNLYEKWVRPWIGEKPLPEITVSDLKSLQHDIIEKHGMKPRTAQYALAICRQALNEALKEGYITENAVKKMDRNDKAKVKNAKTEYLRKHEAKQLLNALKEKSTQTYLMALTALHTGARFGELAALKWRNVDFEKGTITYEKTKNNETRTLPMTRRLKEELSQWESGSELVFPAKGGGRMRNVSRLFYRTVSNLGLNDNREENINFHSLRHTYASWQVINGMGIYPLSKLLGHKSTAMTARYAHLHPENIQGATAVFDEA